MTIQEILKKVVAKEELTAEELDYLKSYEPLKEDGRIPKDRLDKEIEKRKAAEDSKTKLEEQLDELKTKIEELETKGMSEAEKAKAAVEKFAEPAEAPKPAAETAPASAAKPAAEIAPKQ